MTPLNIRGRVAAGFGKGRDFLSIKGYSNRILDAVGFVPFPGTLNLKAAKEDIRKCLMTMRPLIIESFCEEGKQYGGLSLYLCSISGTGCAMIIPHRSRHSEEIIEVIAPKNLRLEKKLTDGKEVILSFPERK